MARPVKKTPEQWKNEMLEAAKKDLEIMKKVMAEHSEKLQRISIKVTSGSCRTIAGVTSPA